MTHNITIACERDTQQHSEDTVRYATTLITYQALCCCGWSGPVHLMMDFHDTARYCAKDDAEIHLSNPNP